MSSRHARSEARSTSLRQLRSHEPDGRVKPGHRGKKEVSSQNQMHPGIHAHVFPGHVARRRRRQKQTSCAISSAVEATFSGTFATTASRTAFWAPAFAAALVNQGVSI